MKSTVSGLELGHVGLETPLSTARPSTPLREPCAGASWKGLLSVTRRVQE